MEVSQRLKCIAELVEKCKSVADIGTDHAYLPIYLIKEGICKSAIASDINKGPVEKAKMNISLENVEKNIECRLGAGLKTISPKEVDVAIIAGMGGNLIRDIIEEDEAVFKSLKYAILQPVQNPEVLRKYLYEKGYKIIDEELCIDENKFYEIMKVSYNNEPKILEDIYYEISETLLRKKHPLLKKYICLKIEKYDKIVSNINDSTDLALERKSSLTKKVKKLEGMLLCL